MPMRMYLMFLCVPPYLLLNALSAFRFFSVAASPPESSAMASSVAASPVAAAVSSRFLDAETSVCHHSLRPEWPFYALMCLRVLEPAVPSYPVLSYLEIMPASSGAELTGGQLATPTVVRRCSRCKIRKSAAEFADGISGRPPRVSPMGYNVYYRFVLHTRYDQQIVPFAYRRLFQQVLVDIFASIDQDRLDFIKRNQNRLRADVYHGIVDHLNAGDADADADSIGTRIILPSSFTGGERFIQQCYHDSMAIVRSLGPPTFFITITANPKWKQITDALHPGQSASDRPDIVGRIFQLKCDALMHELQQRLFGTVAGYLRIDIGISKAWRTTPAPPPLP